MENKQEFIKKNLIIIDEARAIISTYNAQTTATLHFAEQARLMIKDQLNIALLKSLFISRNEQEEFMFDILLFAYADKANGLNEHHRDRVKEAIHAHLAFLKRDFPDKVKSHFMTKLPHNPLMNVITCYPEIIQDFLDCMKSLSKNDLKKIFTQKNKEGQNILQLVIIYAPEQIESILNFIEKYFEHSDIQAMFQDKDSSKTVQDKDSGKNALRYAAERKCFEKFLPFIHKQWPDALGRAKLYVDGDVLYHSVSGDHIYKRTTPKESSIQAVADCLSEAGSVEEITNVIERLATLTKLDGLDVCVLYPPASHKILLEKLSQCSRQNEQLKQACIHYLTGEEARGFGFRDESYSSDQHNISLYLYFSQHLSIENQAEVYRAWQKTFPVSKKGYCDRAPILHPQQEFKDRHLRDKPLSTFCFSLLELASLQDSYAKQAKDSQGKKKELYENISKTFKTLHQTLTKQLINPDTKIDVKTLKNNLLNALNAAKHESTTHRKPILQCLRIILECCTIIGLFILPVMLINNIISGYGAYFHKTHRAQEIEKMEKMIAKFQDKTINDILNIEVGFKSLHEEKRDILNASPLNNEL